MLSNGEKQPHNPKNARSASVSPAGGASNMKVPVPYQHSNQAPSRPRVCERSEVICYNSRMCSGGEQVLRSTGEDRSICARTWAE